MYSRISGYLELTKKPRKYGASWVYPILNCLGGETGIYPYVSLRGINFEFLASFQEAK
jgi:hypothetical protein